jgi:hypothetical protein
MKPIKPIAYIFDIDGTLAKMDVRGPYDWGKVGGDRPNIPVVLVHSLLRRAGARTLIFSGRDSVCEKETRQWLSDHNIEFDGLMMRPAGNTEKDCVVKKRMLDEARGAYCIMGVFDDRDQVVAMWREEGLTCFQVDYGNF